MLRDNFVDTILAGGAVAITLYAGFAFVTESSTKGPPTIAVVTERYRVWGIGGFLLPRVDIRLDDAETFSIRGSWRRGLRLCVRIKEGQFSGRRTAIVLPNKACGKPGPMANGW